MKTYANFIKKVVSYLLIFTVFSNTLIVSAQSEVVDKNAERYNDIRSYAVNFLVQYDVNKNLSEPYELYNFDNEVVALLFVLEDGGYIIVNTNDFSVPEFSLTDTTIYPLDESQKYYNGVSNYFIKKDEKVIDLYTNREITLKEIYNSENNVVKYGENTPYIENKVIDINVKATAYKIPGIVPNYSYNPTGICGSTASAMFFRYYDTYFNGNIVPTNLETTDGIKLIQHLQTFIEKNNRSSSGTDLLSGMNKYLNSRGVHLNISLFNTTLTYVTSFVGSNRPFVFGTWGASAHGDHWMTGYGYSIQGDSTYIISNDGHGAREVFVNMIESDLVVGDYT